MKPSVCRQVMGAHQEQRTCQFISPVKWNIRFLPWAYSLQLFNWKQEVTTVTQPVWNLPSWDASVEKKVKSKLQAVVKASRAFVEYGLERGPGGTEVHPHRTLTHRWRRQTLVLVCFQWPEEKTNRCTCRSDERKWGLKKMPMHTVEGELVVGLNPNRSVSLLFVFGDVQTEAGGHEGTSHPNRL